MMTLFELQHEATRYRDGNSSLTAFRGVLRDFANDYSTHAELDRLAELLRTPAGQPPVERLKALTGP